MFRRLLASLLAIAILAPLPSMGGGCSMDPMIAAQACSCCDSTDPSVSPCAAASSGCGCAIRSDNGQRPASTAAAVHSTTVAFAVESALIPASLSTARRPVGRVELASSPPGAGATVDRPLLCSWIL